MNHQRWTPLLNRNSLGLLTCPVLFMRGVNHLDQSKRPWFLGFSQSMCCWNTMNRAEIAIKKSLSSYNPHVSRFNLHMLICMICLSSANPTCLALPPYGPPANQHWYEKKTHCFPNEMMYIHGGRLYLQYVNLIGRHDHGDAPASQ